jgi:YVTN family beta-propeller protein
MELRLEIRILGPLEVSSDGVPVDVGRGRQRALLAILALHPAKAVSSDELIDELWDGRPPPTASKALQNLVSQLRRTLDPRREGLITTRPSGYVLEIADDAVDALRFERLAIEGRNKLELDPAAAAMQLAAALELWRGPPLADFAYQRFARTEVARLEELRLGAVEDRIEAELALGRAVQLVPELEALVVANPWRERLCGQLLLALYRAGRQADALERFRVWSAALRAELGLEPSPMLADLERSILTHDPALGAPRRFRVPSPKDRFRRRAALAAIAGIVVAAIAVAAAIGGHRGTAPAVPPNSVVRIDVKTNRLAGGIDVGHDPGQVAIVGNLVFVASEADKTLARIDVNSGEERISGLYDTGGSVVSDGHRLWVASEDRGELSSVQPDSVATLDRIKIRDDLAQVFLALGGGSLWTSEYAPSAVTRWSLLTLRQQQRIRLAPQQVPMTITYAQGAAWVAVIGSDELLRIDSSSGETTQIPVGFGPSGLAYGFGSIWATMVGAGTVWRIDPKTRRVSDVIDVGSGPLGVAVGAGSAWVANHCDGTVSRIDPATDDVTATIRVGHFPKWLTVGERDAWVTLAATREWQTPDCA